MLDYMTIADFELYDYSIGFMCIICEVWFIWRISGVLQKHN